MSKFPHLTANGNESDFPNIANVKTYDYDNKVDYSRFDNVQMNITLCKVPWDMGEAHVGNRTISGIGNVVWFGDKKTRDKWFEDIPDNECYRFATKYKELHRDNSIVVPIPFDVAARYNYVAVQYEPFASSGDLLEYEGTSGLENWYWFVREVEFLAPNSTRLHLLNDAWQTFIYDMDIPYMMLERGHYGMSQMSAERYLKNPIANNSYLLAREELEPNAPRIGTSTHEHVFNTGSMYAVVITSANAMANNWGSKSGNDWRTPSTQGYNQGVPTYRAFAVAASSFSSFVSNMVADVPQFMQTVQAVCFVGESLLDFGSSFEFCDTTCYNVGATYRRATVHKLAKGDFGYGKNYADIAKLYTYPYAEIIVTDSNGDETEIRIEDTSGKIELDYCLSLVYPWLQIDGAITSTGKTARRNISFANVSNRNMPIGGNWFDMLVQYEIPTFGLYESAAKVNDYATHFDRAQQAYAGDNAQANANASADLIIDNTTLTTTANTATTNISNGSADDSLDNTRSYNFDVMDSDNAITNATASATIDAQEQQAAISAASGAASSAVGAISSLASGNIAGAVSSAVNGLIGSAATLASSSVAVHLTSAQADIAVQNNSYHAEAATDKTQADTATQKATAISLTNTQNTLSTGMAANSAATQRANAARDRATVTGAINNQIAQAALGAPETFGENGNGEHSATRPLAIYSNVITQDDYTIKRCGDDFLRYGYSLNAQIPFNGNWCVMPKFTYWRLSDFWVKGLQVPDLYVDKIRFFLFGGVTVWKKPEDIGNTSIYENV